MNVPCSPRGLLELEVCAERWENLKRNGCFARIRIEGSGEKSYVVQLSLSDAMVDSGSKERIRGRVVVKCL